MDSTLVDQDTWQMDAPASIDLHPQQTLALLVQATEILYGGAAGGGAPTCEKMLGGNSFLAS